MLTGFNHSGLVVRDLDRMVAFYRDALGLQVLREVDAGPDGSRHTGVPGARRRLAFLGFPDGGHQLELVQYLEPQSPPGHLAVNALGASHLCFNVRGLGEVYRALRNRGVRFQTPLVERRDEGRGTVTRICYGQDPEGNWLEFLEVAPADQR